VYLPEGAWYDFWTHEKYAGGRKIEVTKPVDQIPVFVKDGTLLPLAEPMECVSPATEFALTVHVFGAKPAPFVLYEDDGVTFNFVQGQQNRIELRWDGEIGHTTKTGNYSGPSRFKSVQWTKAAN
jgi:alpha-D-xyloside xylohydrolase